MSGKNLLHSAVLPARCYSHGAQESDEEFDARWVTYFNKPDIDAWELRKGVLKGKEGMSDIEILMAMVIWGNLNCFEIRPLNVTAMSE
uniref:Cytochrome c oxidase subunit 5A, mitochondrial n=1 Tax=Chelonoidis abingdonii TaxID=106734 RepID=A0A8C0IZ93_CHEAB